MGESVGGDTIDRAEVPVVVVGDVYASPSRIQVQGGRREAGGEAVVTAYPDICFAVDDSHTGFDTLVRNVPSIDIRLCGEEGRGLPLCMRLWGEEGGEAMFLRGGRRVMNQVS